MLEAYKAIINEKSSYTALKKASMETITKTLTGSAPKPLKVLNTEEQLVKTKGLVNKMLQSAKKVENSLFNERKQMERSGKHNPAYGVELKNEERALDAIDMKREMVAQKMVTLRNTIESLERIENKDWAGKSFMRKRTIPKFADKEIKEMT